MRVTTRTQPVRGQCPHTLEGAKNRISTIGRCNYRHSGPESFFKIERYTSLYYVLRRHPILVELISLIYRYLSGDPLIESPRQRLKKLISHIRVNLHFSQHRRSTESPVFFRIWSRSSVDFNLGAERLGAKKRKKSDRHDYNHEFITTST
jgi:hypothetical protein